MRRTPSGASTARAAAAAGAAGVAGAADAGGDVAPGSTAMLADMLHKEQQRYEKLIRESNIKPD